MNRPILIVPDPALRRSAAPVPAVDETVRTLVRDLGDTMTAASGIGLAAVQIGIPLRVLVMATSRGPRAFINPTIVKSSRKTVTGEEGCLSIPGLFGIVPRSKDIEVEALDPRGAHFTYKAKGLQSRILQHEIDHLNGILFIDRWTEATSGHEAAVRFGIPLP